ncbi:mediator of RNA polymerase II transcription subunit 13 isoform X1 [Phoenix dactylifera]|uniref:Mediator of RNA polymerase II transcription subunit 13 n=1 Tax=Phoenix dactylifera TaxID=42345 RepID=A0A8B7CW88_PHODC|nr:mediator of RNA polymerase II transcription subunit 13 isoform X1 [Phoenix dactylifera]
MWTNVFRIGELQTFSWFQFLPCDSDPNSLPEKSLKAEQKDAATHLILSAHLQLQNEGFLSTWTNSFFGPWDPSQGVHNPDEKIKLWLFLRGRHSSIIDTAQSAVSRLRVVGSGLWLAPGDSEEVALALSQALRNYIERALRGFSYVRFGDVFTRCHPFTPNEKSFRRAQPTFEFIFSATEEAIYVHAIISAKHIRGLCGDDIERISRNGSSRSTREGLPVIVGPNGMRGRLTGCCPSDLVKQVYISNSKVSNGFTVGVRFPVAQSSGCQLRGQSCYVEVTLGCPSTCSDKVLESNSNQSNNAIRPHTEESHFSSVGKGQQKQGTIYQLPILERTFIYPADAVVIPMMHRAFARSSVKRFWLQNWVGTSVLEMWPIWNFLGSSRIEHCFAFGNTCCSGPLDGLGGEFSGMRLQKQYNSSSNSITSSISSVSSTSSDSEYAVAAGAGDLEADADSLTCRHSGLSSNDQFENDGRKMVSKRARTGTTETTGQAGTVVSATTQDAYNTEYSVAEANNSAAAGAANIQVGSRWDWDDDDRGVGMDIQALISEFGDFGDFFENDVLAFGEPPGTAESQAFIFPASDCGDISGSPMGGMEVSHQKLSPVGLASFEGINPQSTALTEDTRNHSAEFTKDARSSVLGTHSSTPSTGKFDYLTKAEAMMTFAPEYAAVEMPASELPTSIFKSPYLPRSRKVESSHSSSVAYVYNAAPPSPRMMTLEEKPEVSAKLKLGSMGHGGNLSFQSSKLYTHVQSGTKKTNKRSVNDDVSSREGDVSFCLSSISSLTTVPTLQRKNQNMLETAHFLLSLKTVLATELECTMFQAAMCRIRHTLLSLSNKVPIGLRSAISDLVQSDTSTKSDIMTGKYEIKKKDNIPVRIAGDSDGGMHDGPVTAQVGVWRSVGAPKGTKSSITRNSENSSSLLLSTLHDENLNVYGQRQPLQDLLDAMALLVQQSTSFVDVSLDSDDGDGSYCWLALQEQRRRGFSCGPSMVHAGCGGLLATCHSVDIAGIDLIDPLSADIQASSVISLLQSDIKLALKSAFGILDGPLSAIDWCRGRGQSGDSKATGDGYSFQCTVSEAKDSSSTVTLAGEPISPPQSTGGSSCIREGARIDESSQRRSSQEICNSESEQQKGYCRFRPILTILPLPAIRVGYQDDWLDMPAKNLQFWEKGPLEPYASPKPIIFYALCPDIDLLSSAAADFFQQLGTIYEACKLGTHSPQIGGQMDPSSAKCLPSGLVLVDCPQQVKIASNHITAISSIRDYFLALSKGWNVKNFVKSLTKVIKELKLAPNLSVNQKEGSSGPCTVVYVVCPFPEPRAVLQTLIECASALGSVVLSPDKERRSLLHSHVARALNCTAAADEASASNVVMLSGFSIPKLVLQIVTVESLLGINRPVNELAILKDIAFTVYNKARRIPWAAPASDVLQSSAASGRSQSTLMHVTSPIPGLWKDCHAPRLSGPTLTREAELDSALRPGTWDNSWQPSRGAGLTCEPIRPVDLCGQDDTRYMFEPLFILAEPSSVEHGTPSTVFGSAVSETSSLKSVIDDSGMYMQSSTSGTNADIGTTSLLDGSEHDSKTASLHCCYGWTEDWRWLVCIWTDSRGELLDGYIFPFGGISSRQDTKVLQSLFVQILQQGCQILSCPSTDSSTARPRDIIITRFGCFFELECQEWQKAIYSVGGNEVKKWPLQLRRSMPDGIPSTTNGTSLQQQELGLIQDRNLLSSPGPSLYSPHSKSSFIKGGLAQSSTKKQLLAGQTGVDSARGLLQLVQSISLIGVSIDHTLHLILQPDASSAGGGSQSTSSSSLSGYLEGFTPVKSLGSMQESLLLIPSPSLRYLPSTPLQLPTCLTSESPPLAHLLHSKGSAVPLATGYVVSKAVPTMRKDPTELTKEDWPSILAVSLVDHYGRNNNSIQEKMVRGAGNITVGKQGRSLNPEAINRDCEMETHLVLESVAAELHSLSWMTASPVYLERRTALPFHCEMLLRLRRLLHYADKEFSRPPEKAHQT